MKLCLYSESKLSVLFEDSCLDFFSLDITTFRKSLKLYSKHPPTFQANTLYSYISPANSVASYTELRFQA